MSGGKEGEGDHQVFRFGQIRLEIKIFNIESGKLGTRYGKDTIEKNLNSWKGCRWCSSGPFVLNKVASNGAANAIRISFLRAKIGADPEVCWLFTRWDLMAVDPFDGV